MSEERILLGYECPKCGNRISVQEAGPNEEAILCSRCEDGEYTTMEPVYEDDYEID